MYQIQNVSGSLVYENLDTKGTDGKLEVLAIKVREKRTLTPAQWNSRSVQRHIQKKRFRSKQI